MLRKRPLSQDERKLISAALYELNYVLRNGNSWPEQAATQVNRYGGSSEPHVRDLLARWDHNHAMVQIGHRATERVPFTLAEAAIILAALTNLRWTWENVTVQHGTVDRLSGVSGVETALDQLIPKWNRHVAEMHRRIAAPTEEYVRSATTGTGSWNYA